MELYQNRMVVKVGSSTLTDETGRSDIQSFERVARILSGLQDRGIEVILVSSGAVAAGLGLLDKASSSASPHRRQAAAAVGQREILRLYDRFFSKYGKTIGQILLKDEDFLLEERRKNLLRTFEELLELGVIPVVNENDSVGSDGPQSEKRLFDNNDMLAALTAVLCRAKRLAILSDVDGLYDCDPRRNSNAELIVKIDRVSDELFRMAGGAGTRCGTGGMKAKLRAAELAASRGVDTFIINGRNPAALFRMIEGQSVGTLIAGKGKGE